MEEEEGMVGLALSYPKLLDNDMGLMVDKLQSCNEGQRSLAAMCMWKAPVNTWQMKMIMMILSIMTRYYLDRSIVILEEDIWFDLSMWFTQIFRFIIKYKPPMLTIYIVQNDSWDINN